MTEEQREEARSKERESRRQAEAQRVQSAVSAAGGPLEYDTEQFANAIRSSTEFVMCAICAFEGPRDCLVERFSLEQRLDIKPNR
jgi:hypothetical protein